MKKARQSRPVGPFACSAAACGRPSRAAYLGALAEPASGALPVALSVTGDAGAAAVVAGAVVAGVETAGVVDVVAGAPVVPGALAAGATIAVGAWPDAAPVAVTAGSSGTISSATMLMILISGLTAGPAVSL